MQSIDAATFANHLGSPAPSIRRPVRDESPSRSGSDDVLADRVAEGDIDAAETLRARHERHMMDVAVSLVNDEIDAAQIVEAAFEDAFRGWPPERGLVKRWLVRLVRRRARAYRRLVGLSS